MNNVALITGASTGIGKELCHIHAERGGDLVMVARRKDKLEQLKSELENTYAVQVVVVSKDLSLPGAPKEVYDAVKNKNIEVDILINNAGFGGRGKFHERSWDKDHSMIHLNVIALTALTRYFLPDFVARNSGKILNVSSTASFAPGPLQAVYYATKAYVTFFSNALVEELHDKNITVTTLMPGPTKSEFASVSGMDKTELFKSATSARKVAEDGYNGILKGKMNVVSGMSIPQRMMLSMISILPKKMVLRQIRQMQEV